jgi:hypothetical protein
MTRCFRVVDLRVSIFIFVPSSYNKNWDCKDSVMVIVLIRHFLSISYASEGENIHYTSNTVGMGLPSSTSTNPGGAATQALGARHSALSTRRPGIDARGTRRVRRGQPPTLLYLFTPKSQAASNYHSRKPVRVSCSPSTDFTFLAHTHTHIEGGTYRFKARARASLRHKA